MPQARPVVAHVEDYDSDESSAVPGTLVQAAQDGRQQPSSRPQKPIVVRSKSRAPAPPASDSGYSSHASAPQATTTTKPPAPARVNHSAGKAVQPPVVASPTKSSKPKPQIHRIDSGRSTRPQTNPSSTPQDGRSCSDPNCVDPNCRSTGTTNTERRYTLPQHQRPQPQHNSSYASTPTYSQAPYPQYPQGPPMQAPPTMMGPPPPRQRTGSMSRARPVSMYASPPYNGAPPGPPPSASAYYAYNQPVYPQQPSAYAGSMAPPPPPPPQPIDYPPPSPVVQQTPASPSMSTYPGFPGNTSTYSARQANPNFPGLDMPKPMPMPQPGVTLTRTVSARRPNERPTGRRSSVYVKEPESEGSYSEAATASESETDSEYERQLRRRDSRRESRTVVVPARRPSMSNKKYISESSVPRVRRESRPLEVTRTKTSNLDNIIDYPSSSDINDSDRTARAVIHRRDTRDGRDNYSDRSSRRQSVSSKGSSTRTKPSSLSSVTDYSRVIVEGPNGRRTAYLSKDAQADLIRAYQQQKLDDKLEEQRIRQEKIEAYQKATSGQSYDLTAENIKKYSDRKTKSRVSGRSEKSSGSGSRMTNNEKGVRIETGGTVLHVYGGSKIEVREGEDGATLVIAGSNGKESSYLGGSSKGSSSRVGRSRGRRETIHEEYEQGL